MLTELIAAAPRVYVIGNGGSYANASHFVTDLLAVGVRAFTLDPAALSMLANDYGWEAAFAMWLEVVAEPGDLLIALSGSGKSRNILKAVEAAEMIGMTVWKEFGADHNLDMQAAEEGQIHLGHVVRQQLARRRVTDDRW